MKYSIGLYHGRFQHIHLGHQKIIETMISECSVPVVMIGSSQRWGTREDPFNLTDRLFMIDHLFGSKIIMGYHPDVNQNPLPEGFGGEIYVDWSRWLLRLAAHFIHLSTKIPLGNCIPDVVYGGPDSGNAIFQRSTSVDVIEVPRKRSHSSGTKIREALREDKRDEWLSMTDPRLHHLYPVLKRQVLDIEERIQAP